MQFDYGKNVQAYHNRDGTIALGTWSKPFGEGVWQPERTPLIVATWARSLGVPISSMVEPLDAPHGNPANFWTKSAPLLDLVTPVPEVEPVPLVTHPVSAPVEKSSSELQVQEPKPLVSQVQVAPTPAPTPVTTPIVPPIEVHVHLPQPPARTVDSTYVPPALPRAAEPVPAAHHNAILAILERWMTDVRHWL